jgi:pimeloyl-ACP methyl ester carboxylesterase
MLRTAALPGMSTLLSMTIHARLLGAVQETGGRLRRRGHDWGVYLQAITRALGPLQNAGAREAFLQTLRAVIDVHGQRVSATDRLYLLESIPTMIVWGERDHTIPAGHGCRAHKAIPGSRFRTLANAAHFPHLDDPHGLSEALRLFIKETSPAAIEDGDWGAILARRSPPSRRIGDAAA